MDHAFPGKAPGEHRGGGWIPQIRCYCTAEEGGEGSRGGEKMMWSCSSMGQKMLNGILSPADPLEPIKPWLHPKLFLTLDASLEISLALCWECFWPLSLSVSHFEWVLISPESTHFPGEAYPHLQWTSAHFCGHWPDTDGENQQPRLPVVLHEPMLTC